MGYFVAEERMVLSPVVEAVVIDTFLIAQRSLACLLMVVYNLPFKKSLFFYFLFCAKDLIL